MIDDELEFERPTDQLDPMEPTTPPGRGPGPLVAAIVAAVAIAGVAFLVLRLRSAPPAPPAPSPSAIEAAGPAPGPTPDATLPALDQSDAFVRELARALASDPLVTSWLAGEGLIRRFVAVVINVAQGENPASHLGFLAPRQGFHAVYRRGRYVIDPDSYTRFDAFAAAVASVDPAEGARIYRKLRPLCAAAAVELGQPAGAIDALVTHAIDVLVATPVADGEVGLVYAPPLYHFADLKLETLAPAQKQLLRMGPKNARAVQARLREIGQAIAAPAAP